MATTGRRSSVLACRITDRIRRTGRFHRTDRTPRTRHISWANESQARQPDAFLTRLASLG